MKILLASPFFARHWDAGHFWAKALSELGHSLTLWDYRFLTTPPDVQVDLFLALKGRTEWVRTLDLRDTRSAVYWPDSFARFDGVSEYMRYFTHAFTTVRPTLPGVHWIPTGWDPDIHQPSVVSSKNIDTVFFGTYTEWKALWLSLLQPSQIYGNDWPSGGRFHGPVYLWDLVDVLSRAKITVNVHREEGIGVTRRLFESIGCTFTLTDLAPGVDEVLGPALAAKVGFKTPQEGKEKIAYYLEHQGERLDLWQAEREAILPYTYRNAAKKLLEVATS